MSEALKSPADPLTAFERERGRLFGIAYRMLGSVAEAEDVLQDAWLRWQGVDHTQVENPSAYLVRLVTRLSIDTLGAARNRLTDYVGPWLPEPLVGRRIESLGEDPAALQELAADLSTAFLLMLERLTPVERAVFLLRESFDFSYREIAEIVGKTEENCRQIDRRARKHLEEHRRSVPADPAEHDRLVEGFLRAVRDGDMDGMVALLARDATLYSDGGGKVKAAQKPVHGAESIARFLYNIRRQAVQMEVDFELRPTIVNGRTGFVTLAEGRPYNVFALDTEPGKIRGVYVVINPDKLARVEI
ncbi:MAG TPA: RNA polymerase sigma-70 factor [Thermoanaerobaculia bacterium]|jgi:RNA polymerase sigma-70 factor (ECF subfamily)|nr:RNA polymerase sigma-70 factor [Thermoanaerobaculia bacterium]